MMRGPGGRSVVQRRENSGDNLSIAISVVVSMDQVPQVIIDKVQEDPIPDVDIDSKVGIQNQSALVRHGPTAVEDDLERLTVDSTYNQSTVSDLYNATPRSTPEPESGTDSEDCVSREGNPQSPVEDISPSLGQLSLRTKSIRDDFRDEPLPLMPYFDKGFQKALKAAASLPVTITDQLSRCALVHNPRSDLYKLYESAKVLQDFENPASRSIGIVGDSATGKSSLINSMLDEPNLAHKGDQGSAVTSFVTEYRHRSSHHKEPFTIEVEYLDGDEIKEQLHELLYSYRQLFKPDLKKETSAEEYRRLERESEVALCTLQSIFPQQQEVSPSYLQDTGTDAFERISVRLECLARSLTWPIGAREGKWVSTAADAVDCHEQMAFFMDTGLWPLIKIARVYLSAPVLKSGVILADLPGYRDINLARVKAAERYLISCDEVFVVARINRVVSDRSVHDIVREQMGCSLEKRKNINIVCTHAEEIDITQAEKKYCNQLKTIDAQRSKKAKASVAIARRRSVDAFQVAQMKQKYLFISARNTDIETRLRAVYAGLSGNHDINVFCVANKDYQGDPEQSPDAHAIAVEGSGIPDLRRFCHSIVAEAQFRAADHYIEVQIKGLIQSLQVWLTAADGQDPLPVLPADCMKDSRTRLVANIYGFHYELWNYEELQLEAPMRNSRPLFDKAAIEASEFWTNYHWASYAAFVRNNGTHTTPAQGSKRWNAELLAGMNDVMAGKWEAFEDEVERSAGVLLKAITKELHQLTSLLQEANVPPLLIQTIKTREYDIRYLLEQEAATLLRNLSVVKQDATSDHITSYMVSLMIPTYRACSAQHGFGTEARMHDIMARRMAQRDIFTSIRNLVVAAWKKHSNTILKNLTAHVETMCDAIEGEMTFVKCAEEEALRCNPEDLERIRMLIDTAGDALEDLERDAEPAREQARNWAELCDMFPD